MTSCRHCPFDIREAPRDRRAVMNPFVIVFWAVVALGVVVILPVVGWIIVHHREWM